MMRRQGTGKRRLGFTMVEVVLALAVIAIALMSIISLIPIGANAARTAISEGFAADISEHLLHYLAEELTRDTNADGVLNDRWVTLISSLPEAHQLPNIGQQDAIVNPGGVANIFTLQKSPLIAPWNAAPAWPLTPSTTLYSATVGGYPVYRVIQQTTQLGTGGTNTSTLDEIDAVVRVWKSPTSGHSWNGASWVLGTDALYAKRVQLNIEMTWPGTSDFRFRQRAYYTLEVSQR